MRRPLVGIVLLVLLAGCFAVGAKQDYLEVFNDVSAQFDRLDATFHEVADAYDSNAKAGRIDADDYAPWKNFVLYTWRPEITSLAQQAQGAQNREQLQLLLPRIRSLEARLQTLRTQLDAALTRNRGRSL